MPKFRQKKDAKNCLRRRVCTSLYPLLSLVQRHAKSKSRHQSEELLNSSLFSRSCARSQDRRFSSYGFDIWSLSIFYIPYVPQKIIYTYMLAVNRLYGVTFHHFAAEAMHRDTTSIMPADVISSVRTNFRTRFVEGPMQSTTLG